MREWAISILVGFFAGAFVRSFFDFGFEFSLLFIVLGAIFGALFWFRDDFGKLVLYAAVFLVSFGLGILRYDIQDSKSGIETLSEFRNERVTLKGTIISDPELRETYTRAVFQTDDPPAPTVPSGPAGGVKILLALDHYPEVRYGDRLEISGTLKEPTNFADFDWKSYLAKDNIYFEMFRPEIVSREEGGGFWLRRFLFSTKRAFLNNLSRVLPEPHNSFLAGITVGEQSGLPDDLEEDFREVGVIHIVVLSGYNISIVADSVLKVIKLLPVSWIFHTLFASFAIILFTILTGASPAIVRAAIMGILVLFARSTGKIYAAMAALFFAAFLMVLYNPKILRFDVGFQLSFLATLSLIILLPRIEKYFLWFPNKWNLREHLLATISTQIFVMPLILKTSGVFSLVSVPANLLILFAIPLTMFMGFITGLAGFVSDSLSQVFSWFAYFLLSYELLVVDIFSRFSFATFEIADFPVILVGVLYLLIALFVILSTKK